MNDNAAREVVAMQFAGGRAIARLAEEWDRDSAWVEESIRHALLEHIPRRDGGLKAPRMEVRSMRQQEQAPCDGQRRLEFDAEGLEAGRPVASAGRAERIVA